MLVGITGAKRSGKDQFATYLQQANPNVIILKFAGALKEAILVGFELHNLLVTYDDLDGSGVDREKRQYTSMQVAQIIFDANASLNIDDWSFVELYAYLNSDIIPTVLDRPELEMLRLFSIREILQLYGTEIVRKNSDNFWVEEVERRYLEAKAGNPDVIALVTDTRFDNEAEFIRNYNGKLFRIVRDCAILSTEHASEKGLSDYSDCTEIDNNKTLADLEDQAQFNILHLQD